MEPARAAFQMAFILVPGTLRKVSTVPVALAGTAKSVARTVPRVVHEPDRISRLYVVLARNPLRASASMPVPSVCACRTAVPLTASLPTRAFHVRMTVAASAVAATDRTSMSERKIEVRRRMKGPLWSSVQAAPVRSASIARDIRPR